MKSRLFILLTLAFMILIFTEHVFGQWTKNGNQVYVTDPADNVGIGTTSVGTGIKFDVKGPIRVYTTNSNYGSFRFEKQSIDASHIQWVLSHRNNDKDFWIYGYDGTTFKNFMKYLWDNNYVIFDLGNVGIGTTAPSSRLEVNGDFEISGAFERNIKKEKIAGSSSWLNFNNDADSGYTAGIQFFRFDNGGGSHKVIIHHADGNFNPAIEMDQQGNIVMDGTLSAAGAVAIGLTTPEVSLHVAGNIKASGPSGAIGGYLLRSWGGSNSFLSGLGNNLYFDGANWVTRGDGVNNGGTAILTDQGTAALSLFTIPSAGGTDRSISNTDFANYERVRITNSGNMGIGMTNPAQKLAVSGNIGWNNGKSALNNDQGGSVELGDGLTAGNRPYLDFHYGVGSGQDYNARIINYGDTRLDFVTNGNGTVMAINGDKVGIGTVNPGTYKLAVEGKIGAREVVVTQSNWADFVFDDAYTLMPLEQVEQHIKTEKHLPGIPTAKQVCSEGVNLGEMQTALLQKIEELTLYVIDLKKENDSLKERIESLEAQR